MRKRIGEGDFSALEGKPVYCTAAGLQDYADGPYKELVKPYLKKEI